MNILVRTYDGHVIFRPDTTWEKDSEDLYPQDFIKSLSFTPVLFARVSKPGRSVGEKFADRYYDGIGFGLLIFADDLMDGTAEGFAAATCIDGTSVLPFPLYGKITLGQGNAFKLFKDGQELFANDSADNAVVENAIAEVTSHAYIRTGDLIAVELDSRKPLCTREGGSISLTGEYCENRILDFKIVL